jgi:hypothetical protein
MMGSSIGPLEQTADFELVVEEFRNRYCIGGRSWLYAVRNRSTGVIEGSGSGLAEMLVVMDRTQQMLDQVRTERAHTRQVTLAQEALG